MIDNSVIWSPGVTLASLEKQAILAAFRHYRGNKTQTANSLGIAIRTLDHKLAEYKQDKKTRDQHDQREKQRNAEWLKKQRGFTTTSDGIPLDLNTGHPYPAHIDREAAKRAANRNFSRESGVFTERPANGSGDSTGSPNAGAAAGARMESASEVTTEQSVSMPVGEKVQSVLPSRSRSSSNK